MSASGLKMSGSGLEWMGMCVSGWEWLGIGGSGWDYMEVGRSEWEQVRVNGSEWEHDLIKSIIKYAWTYLRKIKRPNNN